jgi:hypothetical protein
MRVHWKRDLGNPTSPGKYPIRGVVGEVIVEQDDIEQAAKLNGNVYVEIAEATAFGEAVPQFRLGQFIPREKL